MGFTPEQAQLLGWYKDARGEWVQPSKVKPIPQPPKEGEERESVLHRKIIQWLEDHGWLYVRSRMDRPTTTQEGVVDFIIAAPGGKTLWVECKARGKKPNDDQRLFGIRLVRLSHTHAVVWTFEEFLDIVDVI